MRREPMHWPSFHLPRRSAIGLVIIFVAFATHAQTFSGAVVGRVIDAQHAVMAGASVTLNSVDRGFERQTTTNREGKYAFELVPPGKFKLRAEASGFAATTISVEVAVAT